MVSHPKSSEGVSIQRRGRKKLQLCEVNLLFTVIQKHITVHEEDAKQPEVLAVQSISADINKDQTAASFTRCLEGNLSTLTDMEAPQQHTRSLDKDEQIQMSR